MGWAQMLIANGVTADSWHPVTSGILQGSLLGAIHFFFFFISDLDAGVLSKFAGDAKLARAVDSLPGDEGSCRDLKN